MGKIILICLVVWAVGSGLSGRTTTSTAAGSAGAAKPAASVRVCGSQFCTVSTGPVSVLTAARRDASANYTIPRRATVQLICWVNGEPVHGDRVWYRAHRPGYTVGYVAGFSMATGADPHPRIKHC